MLLIHMLTTTRLVSVMASKVRLSGDQVATKTVDRLGHSRGVAALVRIDHRYQLDITSQGQTILRG